MLRLLLLPILLLTLTAGPTAQAQSAGTPTAQPLTGWTQVAPSQWADAAGECTYRSERRGQAFPPLNNHAAAVKLAGALKEGLTRQGVREIQVRPVARGAQWVLFATYVYPSQQGEVQVAQLYLSQGGVLNTVTGSTRTRTVSALPLSVQAASTAQHASCWTELTRWIEFGVR